MVLLAFHTHRLRPPLKLCRLNLLSLTYLTMPTITEVYEVDDVHARAPRAQSPRNVPLPPSPSISSHATAPITAAREPESSSADEDDGDVSVHEGDEEAVYFTPGTKSRRGRRKDKLFGMSVGGGGSAKRESFPTYHHSSSSPRHLIVIDPFDYKQKYPPDAIYEETGPNARVWRMCLDEFAIFDADLAEDFRDTVDVLLVFVSSCTVSSSR